MIRKKKKEEIIMKKQFAFLRRFTALMLALCMLTALTAEIFAADIVASGYCGGEGDGKNLTWTLDSEGTLTISGKGKMKNYGYYSDPWVRSSVKCVSIDSGVTCIGDYAFYDCTNLTGVTIPSSMTSIGESAFEFCSSLMSITIPGSVTSIGEGAFSYCRSLTSVTIPNSVTSIGGSAFSYCYGLTSVTIPNSVTSIGGSAFYDCRSLTSVTIPNGVTSIGGYTFHDCSSLTSVTIPGSVTSIGEGAFSYCRSLTSVTIPNSVTSIGNEAFRECSSLTSITIPSRVTSIGGYTFYDCSSLTSVTLPNSMTSIGESAFELCSSLTSVTIPNSVTSIGNSTFGGCDSLTSVTIPNSVTSIGEWAFSYCYGLTSVTIPNSVTSIGRSAFSDCSSLTSVTIPNSVTSIGESAFFSCYGLTSVTIPNSVTSIGEWAFSGCRSLTSVTIPSSVTSIGERAFSYCSSLTSITIPSSVTSIGDYAFRECSSLTSITIPNSVTSIGAGTFNRCGNLTRITIPNSITVIGKYAFGNCGSLTSITIPRSVTSIDEYAFNGCSNLESVYFRGNAPSVSKVSTIFDRCKSTLCIYYMPGTTGWTDGSAYDVEKGTWNGYPLKKMGTDAGNGANGMNSAVSAVYLQEISPNGVCVTVLKTATLKFNTAVQPGSGMISVYSAKDRQTPVYSVSVQDSSVSCAGQTVNIDFSKAGIFEDGEYFIKIDPASFQSENGRYFYGLTDETAWTLDIQRYIPASDIDLKWEKKGIWPFRRDDYSKPPIPAGTDRQYAQALVNWAQSVGITWMSVDEAERLLDKPAYLPITDRYGSTVLLNDGGTTVRQVIKDIVFAENLQTYIAKLDTEIAAYKSHTAYTKKLMFYVQEENTYKMILGWYPQIAEYLDSRNQKSNFTWSLAIPLAYDALLKLIDSGKGTGFQYIKPVLKAYLSQSKLEESTRSLESYRSFEKYKKGADALNQQTFNFNLKGDVYSAVSEGGYGGWLSLGADLMSAYFGSTDNEMLKELSSAWSTYGEMKSAVSLSMFLGSSIGMFPLVVDLHQSLYAQLRNQVKAAYFIGDYYIQDKYPDYYDKVYDSETCMPRETLENLEFYKPAQYATDMALKNWADYLGSSSVEKYLRSDCIEMRRDLANYAVLLRYIRSIDTARAKSMLAKYLDAEHNTASTTLYVSCPVTVEIYDSNGEKLASLSSEDESIQDCEYGTLYLMGENNETKAFVLNSGAYTAKIIPYNSGTMNVLLTGDAQDGAQTAAYYEDVMLTNGQPLTLDLTEQELTENGAVIPSEKSIPVQTVEIIGEQSLAVGESAQLTVRIGPDAASDRSITWTSSEPSVVSVSENGEITAHAAGEATISAVAANGVSAALLVQTYTPVSSISLEAEQYYMVVGESLPAGASACPENAAHALCWRSSSPDVASVDETGMIKAYSAGTAILQTQADGITAEISVTVYASPLSVSLYQSDTEGSRLKVDAVNHAQSTAEGTIYVAGYSDGRLCFVQTVSVSLAAQETMTQYLPIPALASDPEYEVKVFILNEQYKPMQSAVRSMLIV